MRVVCNSLANLSFPVRCFSVLLYLVMFLVYAKKLIKSQIKQTERSLLISEVSGADYNAINLLE